MRRIVLIVFAAAVASVSFAGNEPFRVPDIPQDETRYYKSYYPTPKDEPNAKFNAQRALHEESPRLYNERIHWEGQGNNRIMTIYREENCFNKNIVKSEFVLQTGARLTMLRAHRKWFAPDGTLIRERDIEFNDPSCGYPDGTFHMLLVHMLISAMDLKPKSEARFHVWLTATVVYPMTLTVEGEERIKVEAGEFDCWRVTGKLDKMGLDDLTGMIIAGTVGQYTFWVEKGGTHGLVRLTWPLTSGALGQTPKFQVQDLVKVK